MRYPASAVVVLAAISFGRVTADGDRPLEALLIDAPPAEFARAERVAREWTKYFIAQRYQHTEESRYLALPRAGDGGCDLIRVRYTANGLLITISQSLGMFCVQVEGADLRLKTETLHDVEQIAKLLFKDGATIRLAEPPTEHEAGRGDPTASPNLRWLGSLRWRKLDDGVAFWAFKFEGVTPMGSVGKTTESNDYWYSKRPGPPAP